MKFNDLRFIENLSICKASMSTGLIRFRRAVSVSAGESAFRRYRRGLNWKIIKSDGINSWEVVSVYRGLLQIASVSKISSK